MNFRTVSTLLIFFTLILIQPISRADSFPPQLNHRGISPEATAVYAVWVNTGEPITAYHEKLPLNPASNAKLITSFCALKELGPDFHFETRFYSDTPLSHGEVHHLWVKGEGDPSMVSESLEAMVEGIKKIGLQKISGDLYIDSSYFDGKNHPGWKKNNKRPYNAVTSATSLNFNTEEVQTRRRRKKFVIHRIVRNAPKFFGKELVVTLKQNGIVFDGKLKMGITPEAHLLWKWESKPLQEIVQDMNKFSNNFIAEQITKFLGAKKFGPPGTTENGISVLQNCLQKIGIDTAQLSLKNGSGLSYENYVTAEQLVKVLTAGFRDKGIREPFISSLSVDGVDGTMRKRHSPKELEGILRAKTGSLNNISTLAGFVPARDGNMIAFAILMNHTKGNFAEIHHVQDAIVVEWTGLRKGK